MAEQDNIKNDPEEVEFRKKTQWLSFKGALYGALSGATFIGVLSQVALTAIKAFNADAGVASDAMNMLTNIPTLGAIGAILTVGVALTYMAQDVFTDLRYMQDDHLAKRNAECNAREKAKAKAAELAEAAEKKCAVEYEQNQRADGKQWTQTVQSSPAQQAQALVRG